MIGGTCALIFDGLLGQPNKAQRTTLLYLPLGCSQGLSAEPQPSFRHGIHDISRCVVQAPSSTLGSPLWHVCASAVGVEQHPDLPLSAVHSKRAHHYHFFLIRLVYIKTRVLHTALHLVQVLWSLSWSFPGPSRATPWALTSQQSCMTALLLLKHKKQHK